MRESVRAVAVAAGSAIVGAAGYRLVSGRREPPGRRRHVVTVFRPLAEVRENLAEVFDDRHGQIAVGVRDAPGGRGTEISARAVGGAVSEGEVRRALREGRSLLEVGEVLRPGGPTTRPTLLNRPLRAVTRRGREEGLL